MSAAICCGLGFCQDEYKIYPAGMMHRHAGFAFAVMVAESSTSSAARSKARPTKDHSVVSASWIKRISTA